MAKIITSGTYTPPTPTVQPVKAPVTRTAQRGYYDRRLDDVEAKIDNLPFDNLSAGSDPLATNDTSEGYSIGSRWVNVATDREFVCVDAAVGLAVWVETTAAGGGGGGTWTQQRFVASNAQVSFILGSTPASASSIIVTINGVKTDGGGVDYTVSGTTLTWLNNEFSLEAGDIVSVTYII